ncbi:hypothetical protein Cgig2_019867 [Carnegiea gigantea]|uniref:Uncharacterized protein n=1 Tax=Carnegiea gigantea TaxID=171969 RepID=A0A9Q1KK40_9CARY|nr:hypothetical protein Cgig2_019867 [Carnegiea gigantea]
MVIDSNDMIQTGPEIFKRKQEDVKLSKGQAGGLALLWGKLVTVDSLSCSLRHINVSITLEGDALTWCFLPITHKTDQWANLKVSDLIDRDSPSWHADLVRQIFLPCDVELILSIPLCDSWPDDKLIWHCHSQGLFTVRTAYHMLNSEAFTHVGSSSIRDDSLWCATWRCKILPCIKLFG